MINKKPFTVCLILGSDWSSERGPCKIDYPFTTYECWVGGLLIQEDGEKISLAQDYCPATGNCREIFTIPKVNIKKRFDWEVPEENIAD